MNTCKDCRHWESHGVEDMQRKCNHPKVGGRQAEDMDGADEREGYYGIYTGPDFGCVHWEKKDD